MAGGKPVGPANELVALGFAPPLPEALIRFGVLTLWLVPAAAALLCNSPVVAACWAAAAPVFLTLAGALLWG